MRRCYAKVVAEHVQEYSVPAVFGARYLEFGVEGIFFFQADACYDKRYEVGTISTFVP